MNNPYEIIKSILSNEGFSSELFTVKFKDKININIEQNKDGNFLVSFLDNKPIVKVKRYITLSLALNGILLKENSGIFQIDYFPDISFKYDWLSSQEIGDTNAL